MQVIAGMLLGLGVVYGAWLIACVHHSRDSLSTRWGAWCVLTYALFIVGFLVDTTFQSFQISFLLPVVFVGCAAAGRSRLRSAAARFVADLRALGEIWRRQSLVYRLTIVAGLALVGLRTIRGTLRPPLTWDALTYHLFKAGKWAQSGRWVDTSGPDASAYYDHFSPYGDVLWSWTLLAAPDGALLAIAGFLIWTTVIVGFCDAARALGSSVATALWGAAATAFVPAVLNLTASAYVEPTVLALFLLSVGPLTRCVTGGDERNALFAAAALGLLGGTKASALPIAGVGIVTLFCDRRSFSPGWLRRRALMLMIFLLFSAPPLLRAWVATGSPTYPIALQLGDREVFAGNEQLRWLLRGDWVQDRPDSLRTFLSTVFLPLTLNDTGFEAQNLGPGGAVLVVAALACIGRAASKRRVRIVSAYLIAAAVITWLSVNTAETQALRTFWGVGSGRLLTIVPAVAALLIAMDSSRRGTFAIASLVQFPLLIPKGFGGTDANAFAHVGIVIGGLCLVAIAGTIAWRRLGRLTIPLVVAAVLSAVVAFTYVADIRTRFRYDYYREACERLFELHVLFRPWFEGWPIWQDLDTDEPKRIAVTAGWAVPGHNWVRYPLLGSRLQNDVVYVPITRSGVIVDYQERSPADSDCRAWATRLYDQRIDYLILLPPFPPERVWVTLNRRVFRPTAAGEDGLARAYRIERDLVRSIRCHADEG